MSSASKLMQALELIGAMRHLGTDQSGCKVATVEVRGVTYFLNEMQMSVLDVNCGQLVFAIINDVVEVVYALHLDLDLLKSGRFIRPLVPSIVSAPMTYLEESGLLQENLEWLSHTTGGDIGATVHDIDSWQTFLKTLLSLHSAMRAKFDKIKEEQREAEAEREWPDEPAPETVALKVGDTVQESQKKRKTQSVRFA